MPFASNLWVRDGSCWIQLFKPSLWLLARERILLLSQGAAVSFSEIMIRAYCTLDESFVLFAYVAWFIRKHLKSCK